VNNYDFPWIAPSCKWLSIQKITGRQPIFDAEGFLGASSPIRKSHSRSRSAASRPLDVVANSLTHLNDSTTRLTPYAVVNKFDGSKLRKSWGRLPEASRELRSGRPRIHLLFSFSLSRVHCSSDPNLRICAASGQSAAKPRAQRANSRVREVRQMAGPQAPARVAIFTSNHATADKKTLKQLVSTFANGVWSDFKTTNKATAGKVIKFGAGASLGGPITNYYEVYTPVQWALRGFGPLPVEFIKSGSIQVFEYTTVQRALAVARAAALRFVLITAAYEGGVLIGSVINQTLPEKVQDAIGGTINEIVNEGGWRLLFTHPFGIGM
jgi:hypothetical protein